MDATVVSPEHATEAEAVCGSDLVMALIP